MNLKAFTSEEFEQLYILISCCGAVFMLLFFSKFSIFFSNQYNKITVFFFQKYMSPQIICELFIF